MADYPRPWRHVAADLRARIESGRWQPGDRLPTLGDLQREYGKSKGTIRNAIEQLRTEGLVTSRRGSGIYVASRGAQPTD